MSVKVGDVKFFLDGKEVGGVGAITWPLSSRSSAKKVTLDRFDATFTLTDVRGNFEALKAACARATAWQHDGRLLLVDSWGRIEPAHSPLCGLPFTERCWCCADENN